jgi:hypothetical protein
MADPRAAVRDYLQGAFGGGVSDSMDHAAGGALFRITDPADGRLRHEILVEEAFLTSRSLAEIQSFFSQHRLRDVLARAGTARVVVGLTGLRIDPSAVDLSAKDVSQRSARPGER